MKFATHYDRPPTVYEKGGGPKITETAGYVPPRIQIEQMILAGQRLALSREEMFDQIWDPAMNDDQEPEADPTRRPNYDMVDASAAALALKSKMIKAEREARRKAAMEAQAARKAAEAAEKPV